MSTAFKPPAVPLAPEQYDQEYTDNAFRILVQHLTQLQQAERITQQKATYDEVLAWLS